MMTEQEANNYDKILNEIDLDGNLCSFNYDSIEEKQQYYKAFRYFKSMGLVRLNEAIGNEIHSLCFTDSGISFVHNGGFIERFKKDQKNEYYREIEKMSWETAIKDSKFSRRIAILALVVSIISIIIQVILALYHSNK
jgi:hypothetical protein